MKCIMSDFSGLLSVLMATHCPQNNGLMTVRDILTMLVFCVISLVFCSNKRYNYKQYGPLNTDTFYGPLGVRMNRVQLYIWSADYAFHLILIPLLNTKSFNKSHNWPPRPVILKWNAVELPESNHPSLHEKWKESQKKEEGRGKEGSILLVNLWKLMTVSNFGACTQAWQTRWVVFKIMGFVCKHFLPFFPIPSRLFYSPHFWAVFDSHS